MTPEELLKSLLADEGEGVVEELLVLVGGAPGPVGLAGRGGLREGAQDAKHRVCHKMRPKDRSSGVLWKKKFTLVDIY